MSERTRPEETGDTDAPERDNELSSTWNTIGGTVDIDELTELEELEDLMVEPTAGELGILSDTDVPGRPG